MTEHQLSNISESFETMWLEYALLSPLVSKRHLDGLADRFNVDRPADAKALPIALLNSAPTARLLGAVRGLVRSGDLDLLRYEEARKAYAVATTLDYDRLTRAITRITRNRGLKDELRRARSGKGKSPAYAPPGLLRRVFLAELYTMTRDLALNKLRQAEIAF